MSGGDQRPILAQRNFGAPRGAYNGPPGGAVLQERAEAIIRASKTGETSELAPLNDLRRENMLVEIASQYLRGVQIVHIAQNIGVEPIDVNNELNLLRKRWREASLADFSQRRAEEVAKIDHLESVYWDAWLASQKTEVQQTRHEGFDGSGNKRPARHVTKQTSTVGDVRFLDGVWKCIERRIKLLGLDAEQKHIVAATVTTETNTHDLAARMERYAGLFGYSIVPVGDAAPTSPDDGADESVDTARSPRATGGLSDVIDAEFRDRS